MEVREEWKDVTRFERRSRIGPRRWVEWDVCVEIENAAEHVVAMGWR